MNEDAKLTEEIVKENIELKIKLRQLKTQLEDYLAAADYITIHDEVKVAYRNNAELCFHRVTYRYDSGDSDQGFRFIWRKPDGLFATGHKQAFIPDAATHDQLIGAAKLQGWFK